MRALLDHYLPTWDFHEVHQIPINRTADRVYESLMPLDMNQSPLIKALFFLRGLPARDITLDRMISHGPFKILEERPGKEMVIGLMTDALLRDVDIANREAFFSYAPESGLKIAWNFRIAESLDKNRCRLSTETRILCFGRRTKLFFSGYWFCIRLFSGIIRMEMLKILKRTACRR